VREREGGVTVNLAALARQLGTSPPTLRRAFSSGLVRARRLHHGGFELSPEELAYLRGHWPLLARLREALRPERRVRLAVLYGSRARGDDAPDSDLDLAIWMRGACATALTRIKIRLQGKLELPVDAFQLRPETAPRFLAPVLEDGRVIVDRDGGWARLMARRDEIIELAEEEREALMRSAAAALRYLKGLHDDAAAAKECD
jgi:predicted nucleotidyltransferase